MIAIRPRNGLGNQTFQYAAALALTRRHATTVRIDVSPLHRVGNRTQLKREYLLGCFRLSARLAPRGARRLLTHRLPVVAESSFAFDPAILNAPDGVRLDGYFQSERCFADCAAEVRREFSFASPAAGRNAELLERIEGATSIPLHVRRGDYVTSAASRMLHGAVGPDYYRAALERLDAVEDAQVFVFSDDPAWCRRHLDLPMADTHVDHNGPRAAFDDLRLISRCTHHVIANSTFSWWGAWLNPSPSKIVIAPRHWFADPSVDTRDVVPEAWLRI